MTNNVLLNLELLNRFFFQAVNNHVHKQYNNFIKYVQSLTQKRHSQERDYNPTMLRFSKHEFLHMWVSAYC